MEQSNAIKTANSSTDVGNHRTMGHLTSTEVAVTPTILAQHHPANVEKSTLILQKEASLASSLLDLESNWPSTAHKLMEDEHDPPKGQFDLAYCFFCVMVYTRHPPASRQKSNVHARAV